MKTTSVFLRLLDVARPQIPIISSGIITEILKYGVTLWLGLLGVDLLRMARDGEEPSVLIPVGILILLLAVCRGICGYLSPYLCHVGSYRLLADLRNQFYRTIEPLAPAALINRRTGDIVSIASNNIETLELFFAHTIGPLITALIIPIIVFSALYTIHPIVACIYGICSILIALLPKFALYLNEKRGELLREILANINSFLIDSVQGIREILAFSQSESRYNMVMNLNSNYQNEYNDYVRKNTYVTALFLLFLSGGIILLLIVSSVFCMSGDIDPIKIPIIILFSSVGFSSMTNIIEISKQMGMTFAGAKRLYSLMDLEAPVKEKSNSMPPDNFVPSLSIRDITFRYKPEDPDVLHDVSFEISAGQTVAMVGMTGAGKTTISHLIMRFWDPDTGSIMLGNNDLRNLPLSFIRDTVAMVTQDIFLLNTSILENIRLGRATASDEEVINAAKVARIHDFVISLPKGYGTVIGERGVRLSGGERQRIAIARAVLKDTPILILDEATSALDTSTELEIREALHLLCKNRTVLIIAHRLSTVVHADKILVLREGRIVEEGKHADLISKGGVYASLIKAQEV